MSATAARQIQADLEDAIAEAVAAYLTASGVTGCATRAFHVDDSGATANEPIVFPIVSIKANAPEWAGSGFTDLCGEITLEVDCYSHFGGDPKRTALSKIVAAVMLAMDDISMIDGALSDWCRYLGNAPLTPTADVATAENQERLAFRIFFASTSDTTTTTTTTTTAA
jgi:hypothetical protein